MSKYAKIDFLGVGHEG